MSTKTFTIDETTMKDGLSVPGRNGELQRVAYLWVDLVARTVGVRQVADGEALYGEEDESCAIEWHLTLPQATAQEYRALLEQLLPLIADDPRGERNTKKAEGVIEKFAQSSVVDPAGWLEDVYDPASHTTRELAQTQAAIPHGVEVPAGVEIRDDGRSVTVSCRGREVFGFSRRNGQELDREKLAEQLPTAIAYARVAVATEERKEFAAAAERAAEEQAEAIRVALAAGINGPAIAEWADMTPQRVYQIRDGRR